MEAVLSLQRGAAFASLFFRKLIDDCSFGNDTTDRRTIMPSYNAADLARICRQQAAATTTREVVAALLKMAEKYDAEHDREQRKLQPDMPRSGDDF